MSIDSKSNVIFGNPLSGAGSGGRCPVRDYTHTRGKHEFRTTTARHTISKCKEELMETRLNAAKVAPGGSKTEDRRWDVAQQGDPARIARREDGTP